MDKPQKTRGQLTVKVPDSVLGGAYANQMIVNHTREEFVLDFVALFPPTGVVNARVVVSPGHLKRMIRALHEGLSHYEQRFGQIVEASAPAPGTLQN